MDDLKHTLVTREPRAGAIATVDLSRPGSAQALRDVADDWLYFECSPVGREKLLREHELLAA